MPSSKYYHFCFTVQDHTPEKETLVHAVLSKHCRYYIYGREIAPTTGKKHLQGYCYFKSQKTYSAAIKLAFADHVEHCKGTPQENINYCQKDGDFVVWGEPPKTPASGGLMEKNRWDLARESARKRKFDEIPSDIYIKYNSAIKRIAAESQDYIEPLDNVCGYWLSGSTGTGKSTMARKVAPNAYIKSCNKWWDGYEFQDDVILEDFDKVHSVLAHHLKIWADKFPFQAEIKGGSMMIRPKRIIITSNYRPSEIFPDQASLLPILDRYVQEEFEGVSRRPPRSPLIGSVADDPQYEEIQPTITDI